MPSVTPFPTNNGSGSIELSPAEVAHAFRLEQVEYLGSGESFTAWKCLDTAGIYTVPGHPVLVRIAHRSENNLACPPTQEVTALTHLEKKNTPHAPRLLQAFPTAALSPCRKPAFVLTYQAGRIVSPQAWTQIHFDAHARALAEFHAPSLHCKVYSLHAKFIAAKSWWAEKCPQVITAKHEIVELAENVVLMAEPACSTPSNPPLLTFTHGDLCVTNILFRSETATSSIKEVNFIDFEWSEVDDIARDLAILGGKVYAGPWYVPACDARWRRFLDRYIDTIQNLTSIEIDFELLLQRIIGWTAFERCMMLLNLASKNVSNTKPISTLIPQESPLYQHFEQAEYRVDFKPAVMTADSDAVAATESKLQASLTAYLKEHL